MKIAIPFNQEQWYRDLVEELQGIVVEAEFTSKWALIEGYHAVGKKILETYEGRKRLEEKTLIEQIAKSLSRSTRTIYYAVQFAREYPSLDKVPEGKAINWHKIVHKYLKKPEGKEIKESQEIKCKCPECGYIFK